MSRAWSAPQAYVEIVISNEPATFAIEAIVGGGDAGAQVHRNVLEHFGLNENQLPHLNWGYGLKELGKCASKMACDLFW